MFKKLVSLLMVLTLMLSMCAVSYAKNVDKKEKEEFKAEIEKGMVESFAKGKEKAVEKFLLSKGFKKVNIAKEEENFTTLSYGSDVSKGISAYYSPEMYMYLVNGWWDWIGTSSYDVSASPYDFAGIYMTNPSGSYIDSYGSAVYDQNDFYVSGNSWISDTDSAGVLATISDVYIPSPLKYVGDNGQVWMWLQSLPSTGYLKFQYKHTWNSGTIQSATIGTSGISVTFGTTPSYWDVSSLIHVSNVRVY